VAQDRCGEQHFLDSWGSISFSRTTFRYITAAISLDEISHNRNRRLDGRSGKPGSTPSRIKDFLFSTASRQAQESNHPSIWKVLGPFSQAIKRSGRKTDMRLRMRTTISLPPRQSLHSTGFNSSLGQVNLFTF